MSQQTSFHINYTVNTWRVMAQKSCYQCVFDHINTNIPQRLLRRYSTSSQLLRWVDQNVRGKRERAGAETRRPLSQRVSRLSSSERSSRSRLRCCMNGQTDLWGGDVSNKCQSTAQSCPNQQDFPFISTIPSHASNGTKSKGTPYVKWTSFTSNYHQKRNSE